MWSLAVYTIILFVSNGQNLYGTTSQFADLFTWSEYQTMTSKRVRKEIRDISDDQWDRVADALNVMKNIPEDEGRAVYGTYYRNYDALVCQHAINANGPLGDLAHFNMVFPIWHRAFVLSFENSMIAIDPEIHAFPYWDWRREQVELNETTDFSNSDMFSDNYFGDYHNDIALTNGRFSHWRVHSNASELGCGADYQNAFGLLRGKENTQGDPRITRYGGSLCGSFTFSVGNLDSYDRCLEEETNIEDFFNCFDGPVHGSPHVGIGGSKQTFENQSTDSFPVCTGWHIFKAMVNGVRYWPTRYGCRDCPDVGSCTWDPSDDWANYQCAQCNLTNANGTCNVLGETITIRGDYDEQHLFGDFLDVSTSPNDPLFMFHHANMDRYMFEWQLRNYADAPYYGYPTTGYQNVTRLDDPLGPDYPFQNLFGMDESNESYTVRDILDETTFVDAPYVYDSVLNLVYREEEGSDDDKLKGRTIAVIVVGTLVAIMIIGCLIYMGCEQKKELSLGTVRKPSHMAVNSNISGDIEM